MKALVFAGVAIFALVSVAAAADGDYTVYSWNPKAKLALHSAHCKTFTQARETADVLSALHTLNTEPHMDTEFGMISESHDPLTTWVLQAAEPFQPHEYFWIGDKDKKGNTTSSK